MKSLFTLIAVAFIVLASCSSCSTVDPIDLRTPDEYTFTLYTDTRTPVTDDAALYYGVNELNHADYFRGKMGFISGFGVRKGDRFMITVESEHQNFKLLIHRNDNDFEQTYDIVSGNEYVFKY